MSSTELFARKSAIAALTFLTSYAWMTFIFLPILVDAYVRELGLSVAHAGLVSSGELVAVSIAALASSGTIHRRDKRLLCVYGALLVICGNLMSAAVAGWTILGVSRIIVGAGLGLVVSAVTALPAMSARKEKLYAYGLFGVCVLAALLIFCVPPVTERVGYRGVYYLEIIMSVITLVMSMYLPHGIDRTEVSEAGRTMPFNLPIFCSLASAAIFNGAQAGLWAMAGQAGSLRGLSVAVVDHFLAISAFVGIAGALLAIVLHERVGLLKPLFLGYSSQAALGVILYVSSGFMGFTGSVIFLTASQMFATPYILAVAARLDGRGRVASAAGAMLNFGASAGPTFAAAVTSAYGYPWLGYASTVLLAAGFAIIWWPTRIVGVDEPKAVAV
jgi:predicted MFS family arabinose efflux permease